MASARIAAVVVTVLTGSATAAQAACPQALGVYSEAASGATMAFAGGLGEADGMQHRFSLILANGEVRMDGVVMMAGEPDRPWGVILHNCPEGDATGAEIDACTVWEGAIYAIDGQGETKWLPVMSADKDAGESLLFPDFGAALMRSAAWRDGKITTVPGDVFRLSGCQE